MKRNALILVGLLVLFLARHVLLSATVVVLQLPLHLGHRVAWVLRDVVEFPHLRAQNDHLRATVGQLTQQLTRLQEAAQENERLHRLLDWSRPEAPTSDDRWLVARVIGVSPVPGTRAVVLDRGARAGVRPETPVIVPEGLVGKMVTVHARTSLALLMTDPNFRAGCLIERSRETGVLAGSTEGRLWVQLLPAGADVVVGDVVLTSGLGSVFPKGVRVGTVARVGTDSTRMYRVVEVTPAVAMNRLEEVLCQGAP